jgi:hypothetical protein
MAKIRISLKGERILKREAEIKQYDPSLMQRTSKFYVVFEKNKLISNEIELPPGQFSLNYRINTAVRDSDYEVMIQSVPKEDLDTPENPRTESAFGNIGIGEMPFNIV